MGKIILLWGKADRTWRKANSHLFRSDDSLRWWWRDPGHRKEVIEAGVVAMIAGRVMVTNSPRLTELVIGIGHREARSLAAEIDE